MRETPAKLKEYKLDMIIEGYSERSSLGHAL